MKPFYTTDLGKLFHGDCLEVLKQLPDESVNCCVTSPPYYGLRSYLPGVVVLKKDAPQWILNELNNLGIKPLDK